MDRRLLLAIGLMLIVAVIPSILWPPEPQPDQPVVESPESLDVVTAEPATIPVGGDQPAATPVAQEPSGPTAAPLASPAFDSTPARMVVVESGLYRLAFSTRGARLLRSTLLNYRSFSGSDSGLAQLLPDDTEFMAYTFTTGADTLHLEEWDFEPSSDTVSVTASGATLSWIGRQGALEVRLTYRFQPDTYRFDVEGEVVGAGAGLILVGLGPRLRSIDGDSAADIQTYGVVTKARKTDRLNFRSLDPLERRELEGPFEWVAIKSKYFVAALLTLDEGQSRFGGAVAVGGLRVGKYATDAQVTASLPAPQGRFGHSVYVGPQEQPQLAAIGHGFEDVNPYGWILRPIIRPVANLIVRILLWMHDVLTLSYGWVLILFGLLVRILLWPLNQKAMRASTAMQAIQPEMKALQEKYKPEPQKLQQEMMKLYKEHGVNPLGSCLPMLIPMPVLFALFFVFANTIEFRGVPFLWLPDLSRADPLYIIPLLMGASMFAVTKISQRGVPPNPQAKMMVYVMPVVFTFLFLRFSSGLNLYYAVSNIASIPQQLLISKERIKRLGNRNKEKG
jgi:YidC/Oxa1 family membrane protein insertase